MNAPLLLRLFESIYLLAIAAWVGSTLFFSFAVAPAVFKSLDREHAGRFLRVAFPIYYAWGVGCGAVALPALVCGTLTHPELRGPAVGIQAGLILLGVAITLYAGNVLTPAINKARELGESHAEKFKSLHKRSVILNLVVLLVGLCLVVGFVIRPRPMGQGIVEPSPRTSFDRSIRALQRAKADWEAEHSAKSDIPAQVNPAGGGSVP